ncbi:c-type cytochrome [Kyrpidia tusciae]|uniref:Cytochrome c class I n=1 Tax=Kyrpidia tusciae (strain DSM 2912 / NBRC 15312 / T2) TaxID=562970 RepID=D5WSG1_KYRT2|nr:c-type cytochrome [Kyrpidia tusciae]ADG05046.1 cytochrome c class I [Kyrpidia tusciae DSM 2912]
MGPRFTLLSVAVTAAVLLSACSAPATSKPASASTLTFNPPSIDSASNDENGKAIQLGYKLMTETKQLLPNNVGNDLSCSSCHADAGTVKNELNLVGIAAVYPQFRTREHAVSTLEDRVNQCFERSMNGKTIPYDSTEMRAFMMYLSYISKGIPDGTNPPWRGLAKFDVSNPNLQDGEKIFQQSCATCHGANGQGGYGPALWGPNSFNDGAGMANLSNMAAFVKESMPKAPMGGVNPGDLTQAQARDVSAWVLSHPRPHFLGPGKGSTPPKSQ